jgi:hypothetical protein
MTIRPRSPLRPALAALALALWAMPGQAQDTPLYRDPSPMEGPRIEGPLLSPLPPRASQAPPPPSSLGPFQPANSGNGTTAEPIRDPLLIVQPIPPPLQAMPAPLMQPFGDVQVRRKTTIRPPNGPLGRCHVRLREALFGPAKPPVVTTYDSSKRGFFAGLFQPYSTEGTTPSSPFHWPSWPLSGDR